MNLGGALTFEGNTGRKLGVVVTLDAIPVDQRPLLREHGLGRAGFPEVSRGTGRSYANDADVDPISH
jgi:hypothetical protein